ncbi:hypothetical protein [Nocardia neocaledoniensis]|uniref:hypothetical protein n=1 Tax=Nocardia neocaledoniensis TaxID=236511 RepID=UPI0024581E1A|nr:hypothetical protein [Nocardia neocaledoniensis]
MTDAPPATDLVLPLRPRRFDPHAEDRQLQLTVATALPPVCPAHGLPAIGPTEEILRFWGKAGAFRQEGVGRNLLEALKAATLGKLVAECNEPTVAVQATWPKCERCVARADARVRKLIVYYVGSLFPLLLAGMLYLAIPSAVTLLAGLAGVLLLFAAIMLGPAVFTGLDRYLVAAMAPDAGTVTVRVHPEFARAWTGLERSRP